MEYLVQEINIVDGSIDITTAEDQDNASIYALRIDYIAKLPNEYYEECLKKDFPERLANSRKFVFREDALRSLGVAVLLKEVLGLTENDVKIGKYGKPYSDAVPGYFSVSHSGDWVVLAVSSNNVGVDIEKIDMKHCEVDGLVYTDEEIEWYSGEQGTDDEATNAGLSELKPGDEFTTAKLPEERFMRIWTLKECVSKITGLGMNTDYKSFTVMPLIRDGRMNLEGSVIHTGLTINNNLMNCESPVIKGYSTYELDGYCLSVCVEE